MSRLSEEGRGEEGGNHELHGCELLYVHGINVLVVRTSMTRENQHDNADLKKQGLDIELLGLAHVTTLCN